MSQKEQQSFPFHGDICSLVGQEQHLFFVTQHKEGFVTPLYQVDIQKATFSTIEAPVSHSHLQKLDQKLFLAGTDRQIRYLDTKKQKLVELFPKLSSDIVGLATCGSHLAVLTEESLSLGDPKKEKWLQKITLPSGQQATCCAFYHSEKWLAIGTQQGFVHVFTNEDQKEFGPVSQTQIHTGAITHLLFDPSELMVLSWGMDKQFLMSYVRGTLDTEERSTKGLTSSITGVVSGKEGFLFTANEDETLKRWPSGYTKKVASTTKTNGKPVCIDYWEHKEKKCLVIANHRSEIFLYPLNQEDKIDAQDCSLHLEPASKWAQQEFLQEDEKSKLKAIEILAGFPDEHTLSVFEKIANQDKSSKVREKAVEHLIAFSHKQIEERLCRLLASSFPKTREIALDGLQKRNKMPQLLLANHALATNELDISYSAIALLEKIAPEQTSALDRLIRLLQDKNEKIREVAMSAIERYYKKDPMEAVVLGLNSSYADVRKLGLLVGYRNKQLSSVTFACLLRKHLDDAELGVRRWAFCLSLKRSPQVETFLRSEDEELHRWFHEIDQEKAATPSKKMPTFSEEEKKPLLEALCARNLEMSLLGAKNMAKLHDERSYGTLLQLSCEPNETIRKDVCKAFQVLGDKRAISRLESMLQSPEHSVATAAFTALHGLQKENAKATIQAGFLARDEKIRQRALALVIKELSVQKVEDPEFLMAQMEKALHDSPEVRKEAFKSILNSPSLSKEEQLRFLLKSSHANIRQEVLLECKANKKEDWSPILLVSLLQDADASIRLESFQLLKQQDKKSLTAFGQALKSPFEDLRQKTMEELIELKEESLHAERCTLLAQSLKDSKQNLRALALNGLLQVEAVSYLAEALDSSFPDVRLKAITAQAKRGYKEACEPLRELLTRPMPPEAEPKKEWKNTILEAIQGAEYLADEELFEAVSKLVLSNDSDIAIASAKSLLFLARSKHLESLLELQRLVKDPLRTSVTYAIVATGSTLSIRDMFAQKNNDSIRASWILLQESSLYLSEFLSHTSSLFRNHAYLLFLFHEWIHRSDRPLGLLAALSSPHSDIRLKAACAMEVYEKESLFEEYVVEQFNFREKGDSWKVDKTTLFELANLLVHGKTTTRLRLLTELLPLLETREKGAFETWWKQILFRFEEEKKSLSKLSSKKKEMPSYLATAFGSYLGILRQESSESTVPLRQTAIRRLIAIAKTNKEYLEPSITGLQVSLHDSSAVVREASFQGLQSLGVSPQMLAEEARVTEHQDVARWGMEDLLEKGSAKEATALLYHIQNTFVNGLEDVATSLLVQNVGSVKAYNNGLRARSEKLRSQSVYALAELSNKDPEALKTLLDALNSGFEEIQQRAAIFLANQKEEASVPVLMKMLEEPLSTAYESLKALTFLKAPPTTTLLLDILENRPTHPYYRPIINTLAKIGNAEDVARMLQLFRKEKNLRNDLYESIVEIAGFTQVLLLEKGKLSAKGKDPKALEHKAIHSLLEALIETGEEKLMNRCVPLVAQSPLPVLDGLLHSLLSINHSELRIQVVQALSLRLKEFKSPKEPLLEALQHKEDPNVRFYAAEGLALAGYNDGLQILLTAVELMDYNEQERAVLALGHLSDKRSLEKLLEIVHSEDSYLKEAAVESLGHMKNTERADEIFSLLKSFSESDEYSLQQGALSGLRWFDSESSWGIIYEHARKGSTHFQLAIQLLGEKDTPSNRQWLLDLFVKGHLDDYYDCSAAVSSLRKLFGKESLEPDYAYLYTKQIYCIHSQEPDFLKRIKEQADPLRLLEIYPYIPDASFKKHVYDVLLTKEPLPVEAASQLLKQANIEVDTLSLVFKILGQAEYAFSSKQLNQIIQEYFEKWSSLEVEKTQTYQNHLLQRLQAKQHQLENLLAVLFWVCVRVKQAPKALIGILEDKNLSSLSLRKQTLLSLESLAPPKEFLPVLQGLLLGSETSLGSLVASLLPKVFPKEMAKFTLNEKIQTPILRTLLDIDSDKDPRIDWAIAQNKVAVLLPRLVEKQDLKTLQILLKHKDITEETKGVVIESIGRCHSFESEEILATFGKDSQQEEELRKLAWRALRRIKRRIAKQAQQGEAHV